MGSGIMRLSWSGSTAFRSQLKIMSLNPFADLEKTSPENDHLCFPGMLKSFSSMKWCRRIILSYLVEAGTS